MPTYGVEVIRTAYGFYYARVEARNAAEAELAALEEAANTAISETESDYEVWDTREVE